MKLITLQSNISKIFIISLVVFISFSISLQAQDKFLRVGTGLMGSSENRFGYYDARNIPIFIAGESNKLLDLIGITEIDFVKTGFYVNFAKHTYNDTFIGDADLTSLGFGGRFTVSPLEILSNFSDKNYNTKGLDIYAGTQIGYEVVAFSNGIIGTAVSDFQISPFVGVQYLVGNRFGLYAELGRTAYGLINVGCSVGFGSKH